MKQNFHHDEIPIKTSSGPDVSYTDILWKIKLSRNWKFSELRERSAIASTINAGIEDFQKLPKIAEMALYGLFIFNMLCFWKFITFINLQSKNEFHCDIAIYMAVSEITLESAVLTGNHNLLNIEYYSKVLDNRFWYPVGY